MEKLFESLSHLQHKCGVYLIKIEHRIYIGSAINLQYRLLGHRSELRRGKNKNAFVQACFNKYGKDSCYYTILEECLREARLSREKYWIDKLNPELNLIRDPTTQQNCVTTSKVVYQYTLSGNFIAEFPSASEAARQLQYNGHTITKCCTGKHGHKSYRRSIWSYQKHEKLPEYQNKRLPG